MKEKKFLLLVLFVLATIFLTGCSTNIEQKNIRENKNSKEQQNIEQKMNEWTNSFNEVSLDSLELGIKVIILGTSDNSGNILAEQIIIGEGDFLPDMPEQGLADSTVEKKVSQSKNNFERPNFDQIQNMDPEKREQMAGKVREGRENAGVAPMKQGGPSRVKGEIINIDDSTITLKLFEAGSKIIFYTEDTKVLEVKEDLNSHDE